MGLKPYRPLRCIQLLGLLIPIQLPPLHPTPCSIHYEIQQNISGLGQLPFR